MPDSRRAAPLRWLDRLPIRWRLAVASAILTGLILLVFAVVIGSFTTKRIRDDFTTQTAARFDLVQRRIGVQILRNRSLRIVGNLEDLRGDASTVVNVVLVGGPDSGTGQSSNPNVDLGRYARDPVDVGDYRVETRLVRLPIEYADGRAYMVNGAGVIATVGVQVGRTYAAVERSERRVVGLLTFGVAVGTLLALLAGWAVGTRAMRPVKRMTGTARHIARTRDLEARVPQPPVDDEISELAATLQDMLDELAAAQARIDAALQQQRDFVADASHELRTPLTSVMANLELIAMTAQGEDREAAESALRSSRRMRLLVTDLLLLARMDAKRETVREPVDLDRAVLEAVDELEPQLGDHEIVLDLEPATVDGVRDELVRVVANLVANALRHTPGGTEVRVRLRVDDGRAELVVEDDGPGIPVELRERIFDRFVRRGGEGAGSTGIGLAIVRAAAERHDGTVRVEATRENGTGARFVVTLGARADDGSEEEPDHEDERHPGGDLRLFGTPRRAARRIQRRLRGPRSADDGGRGDVATEDRDVDGPPASA